MTEPRLELEDGYYELAPGKIVTVVTWLEQLSPPNLAPIPTPEGLRLERWTGIDRDDYLRLFRAIGTPWLWFGRLEKSAAALADILSLPDLHIHAVWRGDQRVGLLELEYQPDGQVEVAYFGLTPEETGNGAGRWLMDMAQRMAWAETSTQRLWVHTCSADHPGAVSFYQRMGFAPYKRGIEIANDPRHSGLYPPETGPSGLPFIA